MEPIAPLSSKPIQTPYAPPLNLSGRVQPTDIPAPKRKSKFGQFIENQGGAVGLLEKTSNVTSKAAAYIKEKQARMQAEATGVNYQTGLRKESQPPRKVLGMPAIAAYTAIGVVMLIVLFIVWKLAAKK